MSITPLPTPVPSTDDPANFDARADAFLGALPLFVTEANALAADLNNLVAAAYTTVSSTPVAIGTGAKSFTVELNLGYTPGMSGIMASAADPTKRMLFSVTSYVKATGAMAVSVSTASGSGTPADWVIGLTPAGFTAGQIPGTATNDSAGAGCVGEFISSTVLLGSAVSVPTATDTNITSISLTAGNWRVSGDVWLVSASATATQNHGWISTTSATQPTPPNSGAYTRIDNGLTSGQLGMPVGNMRLSLASTTTVYLSTRSVFPSGSVTGYGFIGAERTR